MEYISIFLPTIILLLIVGAFAGILAGLLGVGGGIVLVPAFFYAFTSLGYLNEQLMQICVATSLATIVFTSIRSVLSHNKKNMVEWQILKLWSGGIVFVLHLNFQFAAHFFYGGMFGRCLCFFIS